jgi:hypothetical protein
VFVERWLPHWLPPKKYHQSVTNRDFYRIFDYSYSRKSMPDIDLQKLAVTAI